MAKNVTIAGAAFSAVPSIDVPQTGGGTASFFDVSDTTATAADVAQGKVFYAADGTETTGTASGGGASNIVMGTFTPTAESGTESIQIPYTGTGYPIMAIVVVEGGAYDSTNTEWYDLVSRYAIGMWCMTKSVMESAPTEADVNTRLAVIEHVYKSSTSSATTYSRYSQMNVDVYTSQPRSTNAYPITFYDGSDNHVLAYNCTGYGLRSGITYSYLIVYSE